MDILKGNVLTYLTVVGVLAYAVLYGKVYQGSFREIFCYYRKKNAEYECKIMITLLGTIGMVCVAAYYGLCKFMKYETMGLEVIGFVALSLLTCYLFASSLQGGNATGEIVVLCLCALCIPILILVGVTVKGIKFDDYCGVSLLFLLVMDIYMWIKKVNYWKKGDW